MATMEIPYGKDFDFVIDEIVDNAVERVYHGRGKDDSANEATDAMMAPENTELILAAILNHVASHPEYVYTDCGAEGALKNEVKARLGKRLADMRSEAADDAREYWKGAGLYHLVLDNGSSKRVIAGQIADLIESFYDVALGGNAVRDVEYGSDTLGEQA